MIKRKHTSFILTPIVNVLEEAINATSGIEDSISSFPIWEYILQSVFLRMTGFQEQKLKCIIWELSTDDYEYRYKTLQNKLGECSNFDDKKKIFKDLIEALKSNGQLNIIVPEEKLDRYIKCIEKNNKNREKIDIICECFKKSLEKSQLINIFKESFDKLDYLIINSRLCKSRLRDFYSFKLIYAELLFEIGSSLGEQNKYKKIKDIVLMKNNRIEKINKCIDSSVDVLLSAFSLFENVYKNYLYKHRNRVAHNLLSYQQNLPTLSKLKEKNNKYENYFLYFFMLIFIDELFIYLYKKYLKLS